MTLLQCLKKSTKKRCRCGNVHCPKNAQHVISRGHAFADGRPCMYFQTVLPPNSPNCSQSDLYSGGHTGIFSASSLHSGGVNTVFVDGSVRFVSETVDVGNLSYAGNITTGESQYGIWGALGSIAGGESKSL